MVICAWCKQPKIKDEMTKTKKHCTECDNAYGRKWHGEHKEQAKDKWLRLSYGITLIQYNELLKNQDFKCAICNKECTSKHQLSVDHDHETGKIRGLLCKRCNIGLGMFKDDVVLCKSAIKYLSKII